MTIEQAILEQLKTLPVDRQQQVLDFVEFLKTQNQQDASTMQSQEVSVLEAAGALIGAVEGPGDLSTARLSAIVGEDNS